MKRKLPLLFTVTLLVAVTAIAQFLGPGGPPPPRGSSAPGPPPGGGPRSGDGHLAGILGLSDAQKAQWTAIRNDFAATLDPLFEKQRSADQAMAALMDAKSNDACAIGTAALATRAAHDQIYEARETLDRKLASVLTPEQKAKFEAILAERELAPGRHAPPPRP
jgi:Spy/CpxP family protein refolding chaperone